MPSQLLFTYVHSIKMLESALLISSECLVITLFGERPVRDKSTFYVAMYGCCHCSHKTARAAVNFQTFAIVLIPTSIIRLEFLLAFYRLFLFLFQNKIE